MEARGGFEGWEDAMVVGLEGLACGIDPEQAIKVSSCVVGCGGGKNWELMLRDVRSEAC